MAWISDPNFNYSLFAIDAFAPFSLAAGNKVISMSGGGVIYNNEISVANQDIEIDFTSYKTNFGNGRNSFGLIGRRQANGNFYYGAAAIRRGGPLAVYQIYKYDAMLDTFTQLATSGPLPVDVPSGSPDTYKLTFKLIGSSLSILFDGSSRVTVTDSFIAAEGNPGLASNLFNVDSLGAGAAADNFLIRNYD